MLLILSISGSCINEEVVNNPSVEGSGMGIVRFTIKVPGAASPQSRATFTGGIPGNAYENEVDEVAVLLFETDAANNGSFISYINADNIASSQDDEGRVKTLTVEVPVGTYNVVLIANAQSEVEAAIAGSNSITKNELLKELKVTNSPDNKWGVDPDANNYYIPMWGEVDGAVEVKDIMPLDKQVNLLRMLAKIDVMVKESAQPFFELESVRLYNYNTVGHVVPLDYNNADVWTTEPSIPAGSSATEGPLLYNADNKVSVMHEIYTFEAKKGSANNLKENTCVVVGGRYNSEVETTYYRIDFTHKSSGAYLPILRNYIYEVEIASINGSGYLTPDDAFYMPSLNIEATVTPWSEADMGGVDLGTSNPTKLDVNHLVTDIYPSEGGVFENHLEVLTNYPSGWKLEGVFDAQGNEVSWLSVSPAAGLKDKKVYPTLTFETNSTKENRVGFIRFSAGKSFSEEIQVEQDGDNRYITYGAPKKVLPKGTVLDVAKVEGGAVIGSLEVLSDDGKYAYTANSGYERLPDNTDVTLAYTHLINSGLSEEGIEQFFEEVYSDIVTVGILRNSPVHLNIDHYVVTGSIKSGEGAQKPIPVGETLTVTTDNAIATMIENSRYKLVVNAGIGFNEIINIQYVRPGTGVGTHPFGKDVTINILKDNQEIILRKSGS